eukprot:scaffold115756_cov30-Phaeocystis_antarctica.AAC.1
MAAARSPTLAPTRCRPRPRRAAPPAGSLAARRFSCPPPLALAASEKTRSGAHSTRTSTI